MITYNNKNDSLWLKGVCGLGFLLAICLATPALGQQQLKIGVPLGFPPFSYQDEGENEVRGYSVDVLEILCKNISIAPRYLVGRPEDLFNALKDGDLDLVIGLMVSESQRQQFNTLEIVIYVKRHIFVHHPGDSQNGNDHRNVNTVVVHGQPHMASGLAEKSGEVIQARSVREALMMVNSGQAKEFIDYSDQMATYLIGKHGLQNIRQAGVQMRRFPFTMIISKDNKKLNSGLSQALGQAIKSGELDQVREKWLGKSYAVYLWERFAPLFVLSASTIASFVVLFFVWHIALKRKVTKIAGELKVSEERYRQLIESSPDMVFLINKKGWIRLANHSASERLLIPQDQLLLSNLKNLVVTKDAGKFDLFLDQLFSHRMAALETKLTNFSGREIIVEFVAASLRRSSEEERLACCFARDLTKRKRMEQELIVSERLATIGKMAAGVAHEVNNPIGIILAHAEDLISGELDQSETQESLNAIRRNALRAGNITRAMLEQASTEQSEKIDLDISVVLKECLDYLKPRLKKISVIRHLKTEQYWTQGDENQLQQVFINLFLNAVESMSGAGIIRVSVDRFEKGNTGWYRIRIEDSGKGIPAHQRQQIFDPFFTKGKSQGVGLGLFVATRIIKNHGGNIFAVDSDLGGVTMNVDLPAKAERKNGNPSTNR